MGSDYEAGKPLMGIVNLGNVAGTTGVLIPINQTPIAFITADVDINVLEFQVQIPVIGWAPVTSDDNTLWIGTADRVRCVPSKIRSDGVNLRVYNTGINQIDNLYMVYEG